MNEDFPAAHSMDTEWFAVDLDGHVGFFETGEPGPVPVDARTIDHGRDVLKRLFFEKPWLLLPRSHDDLACHAQEVFKARPEGVRGLPFEPYDLCLLARSRGAVLRLHEDAEFGNEVFTAEGALVSAFLPSFVSEQTYRALHEEGMCAACIDLFAFGDNRPERLEIFHYDAGDNYHNGPYTRSAPPNQPIRIDELSESIRSLMAPVPLNVRFNDVPNLQPLELTPCHTWGTGEGGTYLGSDLKTVRPLPAE